MFSLKQTLFIFLILFVPFSLRILGEEPYPAILLPSGAFKIKYTDHKASQDYKELYYLNSLNEWVEIDRDLFLQPIPAQYLKVILNNDFGFSTDSSIVTSRKYKLVKRIHILKDLKSKYLSNIPPKSKIELSEVRLWLKRKLLKFDKNSSKLKLVNCMVTISDVEGRELSKRILEEKIIDLNE